MCLFGATEEGAGGGTVPGLPWGNSKMLNFRKTNKPSLQKKKKKKEKLN